MMSEIYFQISSSLISIKHLPCSLQFGDHLLISKLFLWFSKIPVANDFDRPAPGGLEGIFNFCPIRKFNPQEKHQDGVFYTIPSRTIEVDYLAAKLFCDSW